MSIPVPDRAPFAETPVPSSPDERCYGSDAIALMLRALDIPYVALNPGASFRGLHDSLVNRLGNERPQMLLCLHEESAVAIAHGYAKVTQRMLGVVLHSNVGLMHATMAIFNAWCDRVPMLLLGATGPVDAKARRPWIDWIHTAADQGALIRDYTKWDDQPGSVGAALDALAHAVQLSATPPYAPVYVNFDAGLQEEELAKAPRMPDVARFAPPVLLRPDPRTLADAVARLRAAKRPVILMGRVSRSEADWAARVALAEWLAAPVVTDLKVAAAFPTDHPLHAAPPGAYLAAEAIAALRDADVVLALDWVDLAGTLAQAWPDAAVPCVVINATLDAQLARGWSKDHFALPPADIYFACDPDVVVAELVAALGPRDAASRALPPTRGYPGIAASPAGSRHLAAVDARDDCMPLKALAQAVADATEGASICISRLPLGWNGAYRDFRHPLDYIGLDGGGGVGGGPGLAIGAALGLKGSGRISLAIMGDGDFLMGVTALWTAVHYGVPCLTIVANNRSFYNDERHQERIAIIRGRPVENKGIGQRIEGPDIDLAAMARAQGAVGIGPVTSPDALRTAIVDGLRQVADGAVVVIDARVLPGYDANTGGGVQTARRHK